MYPRLVWKPVDEEERAKLLPVAPCEAPQAIDGRQLVFEDPPTCSLFATLAITNLLVLCPHNADGGLFYVPSDPATAWPALSLARVVSRRLV